MAKYKNELRDELAKVLTVQYDYPPSGEGSIGYKGENLYRFKESDITDIQNFVINMAENYQRSYSIEILAQELITELLDKGLIVYDGYGYKKQKEERLSI